MRIKKTPPKRLAPPNAEVQSFIQKLLAVQSSAELPDILSPFEEWKFPKGDLYHWIGVLDSFDSTLESIIKKYGLEEVQKCPLEDLDKSILCHIIRFTKLLLDNCSNRNIYVSYEHLSNLIKSADLDLVFVVLELLHTPALKASSQRTIRTNMASVSHEVLKVLRDTFQFQEFSFKLYDLTLADFDAANYPLDLIFPFYRIQGEGKIEGKGRDAGLVIVRRTHRNLMGKNIFEVMNDILVQHNLPKDYWFPLFHKLRTIFCFESVEMREKLLSIKLYALSILALTNPEEKTFELSHSELDQIAELINLEKSCSWNVRTCALIALDSFVRQKIKINDFLEIVNANANHGFLSVVLKRLTCVICGESDPFPEKFVSSFFDLLALVIANHNGGNSLVTAGIVPILSKALSCENSKEFKLLSKFTNMLDNLVCGFPSSFNLFLSNEGLTIYLREIQRLSQLLIAEKKEYTEKKEEIGLLKAILKSLLHMLQTSGTADGLRNLVESKLPKLFSEIFTHQMYFGPSIYSISVMIFTTFIHNEPTSLQILLESGLPKAFLDSVFVNIFPSADVLASLPHAFGALCLNESLLKNVVDTNIMSEVLKIFLNCKFVSSLQENDVASLLGGIVDELVRHHPTLLTSVMDCVMQMIERLSLIRLDESEVYGSYLWPCAADLSPVVVSESFNGIYEKRMESLYPQMMENVARFLEGFFQTANHAKLFIEKNGISKFLFLYNSEYLPFDYSSSVFSYSCSHLFRVLDETDGALVMKEIISSILNVDLSALVSYSQTDSLIVPLVNVNDLNKQISHELMHKMITFHGYCGLFADLYCSQSFSAARVSTVVTAGLSGESGKELLVKLNTIFHCIVWEYHVYKKSMPKTWLSAKQKEKNSTASEEAANPNDPRVKNTRYWKFLLTQIPSSIIPIFSGIGKVLNFSRTNDSSKQLAEFMANLFIESVKWKRNSHPDQIVHYNYLNVILGQLNVYFFDQSSYRSQLQALLVNAFLMRSGGMQFFPYCMSEFFINIPEDEETRNIFNTALEPLLNMAAEMISQTTNLFHEDSEKERLIKQVEMRSYGLDFFKQCLERLPVLNAGNVKTILSVIFGLIHQDPLEKYKNSLENKEISVDDKDLDKLCSMGYNKDKSKTVLQRHSNLEDAIKELVQTYKDEKAKFEEPLKIEGELKSALEAYFRTKEEMISIYLNNYCFRILEMQNGLVFETADILSTLLAVKSDLVVDKVMEFENKSLKCHVLAVVVGNMLHWRKLNESLKRFNLFDLSHGLLDEPELPSYTSSLCSIYENLVSIPYLLFSKQDISKVMQLALSILSRDGLNADIIQSALRLLLAISSDEEFSDQISQSLTPSKLISICSNLDIEKIEPLIPIVTICIRHFVEKDARLAEQMIKDLRLRLSGRSRSMDLKTFISNNDYLICRNPRVFGDAMIKSCKLNKYRASSTSNQIVLKGEEEKKTIELCEKSDENVFEACVAKNEILKSLVNEYLSISPKISDLCDEAHILKNLFKECFILQIMAEIFLNFPEFCADLLVLDNVKQFIYSLFTNSCGFKGVNAPDTARDAIQKYQAFRNYWSGYLIVGIFSVESSPSVLSLRRLFVEHLIKVFKDTNIQERMDIIYGRISAGADLVLKILSSKIAFGSAPARQKKIHENLKVNAKILIEKKMIGTLTWLLGEVDMNFPHAKYIIHSVLRALECLTRLANKLSKPKKNEGKNKDIDEMPIDEEFSDDDSEMMMDEDFGFEEYDSDEQDSEVDDENMTEDDEVIDDSDDLGDFEDDSDDDSEDDDSDDFDTDEDEMEDEDEIVIRPPYQHDDEGEEDEEVVGDWESNYDGAEEFHSDNDRLDVVIEEYQSSNDGEDSDNDMDDENDEDFFNDYEGYFQRNDEDDGHGRRRHPERRIVEIDRINEPVEIQWNPPIASRREAHADFSATLDRPYTLNENEIPSVSSHPLLMRQNVPNFRSADSSAGPFEVFNPLQVLEHLLSSGQAASSTSGNVIHFDMRKDMNSAAKPGCSSTFELLSKLRVLTSNRRWWQESKLHYGQLVNEMAHLHHDELLAKLIADYVPDDNDKAMEIDDSKSVSSNNDDEEDDEEEEQDSSEVEEQEAEEQQVEEITEQNTPQIRGTFEDPGIDPSFLEALPVDVRREAYMQHFDERRENVALGTDITVSSSYLDSLRSDIREEFLREHQLDLERRRRDEENAENRGNPMEIDFASFIATLDPELRGSILMEQGEDMISSLPPALVAEANVMRDRALRMPASSAIRFLPQSASTSSHKKELKYNHVRDAPVILEIHAVIPLFKALFITELVNKKLLFKIINNVCENAKVREDLLSFFVTFLHEAPSDIEMVDKCIAAFMATKSKVPSRPSTPKTPKKRQSFSQSLTSLMVDKSLYVSRVLELLADLMHFQEEDYYVFMVSESKDCEWLLTRTEKRDKKGKTKEVFTRVPIVALISLLQKEAFHSMETLESLLHTLAYGTDPISSIVKNNSVDEEDKKSSVLPDKVPNISEGFISLITTTLSFDHLTLKGFNYFTQFIKNIFCIEPLKDVILEEILKISQKCQGFVENDLQALLSVISNENSAVSGADLERFSLSNSAQNKLGRCAKMIDSLLVDETASKEEIMRTKLFSEITKSSVCLSKHTSLIVHHVWKNLDAILKVLKEKEDFQHIATVLLPTIESFFLLCKQVGVYERESDVGFSIFESFIEEHKKILNQLVRSNNSLLASSFLMLVKSKILEFDNKRTFFRQRLVKKPNNSYIYGVIQLNVRREFVFEDSVPQIMGRSGDEVKYGKLNVKFYDEEGVDAGGVTREWYSVLSRQMFNPDYALFRTSAVDKITYQPNRSSWVNPEHLMFFKFVGRVIGKAIYDGKLLDCYFTRSFYKHMLKVPVDYKDMEAIDPEFYKSLVWILENDIDDILELTFSTEMDDFGRRKVIDLKENGRNIPVTDENKQEYVKLVTEMKLTTAIKDQIHAFLEGFHEIVPQSLISIFNEQELELLISGMPDIDIDDWKNNTEYQGFTSSSPQVQWFWRAVRSFSTEERAKLLQFTTGTSKVPLEGFAHLQGSNGIQKFQIHKDFGNTSRLPSAHTCFNQLDIPMYESYEQLRSQLLFAMTEGATGFGFA